MEKKVVVEILEILGSEYSKKWSAEEKQTKIKTWTMMLEDMTSEQGYSGLRKALNNPCDFMPSVGKFKEMCRSGPGKENFEDEAKAAWAVVIDNITTGSSPVFKDTCVAEAIRKMGGWLSLAGGLISDHPFRRRDFIDFYIIAKRSGESFYPALIGHFPELKFIGCKNEAEIKEVIKVMQNTRPVHKNLLTQTTSQLVWR